MIEPKPKKQVKVIAGPEDETEPLLRRSSQPDYHGCDSEQNHGRDEEQGTVSTSRIPPIVRLAMSGQLLALLVASVVDAAIWTAFEAVC
jgi:hypothetical protein